MDKKVLKSERYSLRFMLIICSLISFLLTLLVMLFFFKYKEKVNFDSAAIWWLSMTFSISFILFFMIFLLSWKRFDYYVENGKLTLISNRGKIYVFDLESSYTVYLTKAKYYRGIQIVQKKPVKQKVSLLLKKDDDFLGWLKTEAKSYKNLNPEADLKIKYKSYEKMYRLNEWFIIIHSVYIVNLIFFENIFISLVYGILLIFLLIRIIKILHESKMVISF